jgi:peptide/nickel transport system substrate-binding protein
MAVRRVLFRLAVVIGVVVSALVPARLLEAQGPDRGIIVAATADAVSFHPYKTTDTASGSYQGLVYAGSLLERDPEDIQQFRGNLVERWTVSEDRRTYTFTLRPGLVWSDGVPLTADDFKWTYEQASKPENGWPYGANVEDVLSYDAPDARTLVVRIADPLAVGLEQADGIIPLPRHVWEHLDWNDPARNREIMAPTVSSGPFRLLEWVRGSHAIFVRNDRYHKGRPRLAHYTVALAPPGGSGYELLRNGQVDYSGLRPQDYALARRLENVTVYEWWPATGNWSYIGFNFRQPLLQDVRVRQALAYAIDRQTIIQQVYQGLAQPTYSAYGPTCWCYNPDVPHRDYDPARARALLEEAGYLPGPDGIRVKDGQALRLRLVYGPESSEVRTRVARMARDSFRQVGVEIETVGLPWERYLALLTTPPFPWDLNIGGWQATIDPHWMYQIWSADNIPDLNNGAYRNPDVEALFLQAAWELDPGARTRLYQEIQQVLVEDQAAIFLVQEKAYAGVNNRIGGLRPSPLGLEWNIHEWYVK